MRENFWARKLAEPPGSAPAPRAPAPYQPPAAPAPRSLLQRALGPSPKPAPAQCPECRSPNYATVNGGDPRALHKIMRCFDCGYPVRHTTSGVNSVTSSAPARAARQAPMMTLTTESGRVIGQTEAATGYKGLPNYHPQDTRAGRVD